MDRALSVRKFEDHIDLGRALDDLKRIRHVHCARYSRLEAFDLGIPINPLFEDFFLSCRSPGLIRNLIAFDYAKARRPPSDRTQPKHRGSQSDRIRKEAGLS